MLIQHLLTERLMRTVFDNPDFAQRNAIAVEVEKVIAALTSQSFSRTAFLGQLSYFYEAIEAAAKTLSGFTERQHFINTVYERFFQGYAVKVADTHGIVYTPQPIVDFMCAAVEEVLRDEFGYGLDHPDVCIIDPATGTGNFIINLLHRIHRANPAALPEVYNKRLFANEVMLLPYYVASLNIEHAFFEMTGRYEPFEGLCFVDTLDLAEGAQQKFAFMTEKNSERVERQKQAKITVIIGNPPYNAKQLDENDNNRNRKYKTIDTQIATTYAHDSEATNKSALYDPYIKFFRWATGRLEGRDGAVCFVTNNAFLNGPTYDGFRKHLAKDFTKLYLIDLKGNIRKDSMLDGIPLGEKHTVFGSAAMVGISIAILIRNSAHKDHQILYAEVDKRATREQKFSFLARHNSMKDVNWRSIKSSTTNDWLLATNEEEFKAFIPIASKEVKATRSLKAKTIFFTFSRGVETTRDDWVYDFSHSKLNERINDLIETYNSEVDRWRRAGHPKDVDKFVTADSKKIKWSTSLKESLIRQKYAEFAEFKVRLAQYRPFTHRYVFFDDLLNHRRGIFPQTFPKAFNADRNLAICVMGIAAEKPFATAITSGLVDLNYFGPGTVPQWLPFYTYDEDGSNRRENITDWALAQFRTHYKDDTISKWDIFYYVYGLLHHPAYRERYADNLKRDLPRIPFASDFWAFADAGRKLADLHLNYESIPPYPLDYRWTPGKPVSYRVEKMRLSKDKTSLQINDSLRLEGIPAPTFDYRLGNRSALDWIIDQYQVKTDSRSGITSDPNAYSEDEKYIVNLVGRVVAVSLGTVEIVGALPGLGVSE